MTFIFFTIPSWQLFYILHLKWQLSTIVCVLCLFRLLLNTDTVITNHTNIRAFFTMHAFVCHLPAVILKCWLNVIKTWVRNFEATGSILKKTGGSVRTVHRPEDIAVVREATEKKSTRSCASQLCVGLSEASVRRILQKDLHFYPYKIQVTRALHERDNVNRVFCRIFFPVPNTRWAITKMSPFCKTLSQQKHVVLQSTAPLQLKRFNL